MSSELTEVKVLHARLETKLDMVLEGLKIHMEKTDKRFEKVEEDMEEVKTKMNYAAGVALILSVGLTSAWNYLWYRATGQS